ncbi:hypothetical protein ACLOJK_022515, partial [Asimina triloba]
MDHSIDFDPKINHHKGHPDRFLLRPIRPSIFSCTAALSPSPKRPGSVDPGHPSSVPAATLPNVSPIATIDCCHRPLPTPPPDNAAASIAYAVATTLPATATTFATVCTARCHRHRLHRLSDRLSAAPINFTISLTHHV